MKPLLIVANLKSNKTLGEAREWLETISKIKDRKFSNQKKIIVCPPFTLLQIFRDFILENNLPIELGSQNISHFPQGAYTGEINGAQIKDFANYTLVGHSERRGSFGEDESVVEEKVRMSIDYGLTPILCIQNIDNKIFQGVSIVAYEPVFAIGTGRPDTPQDASEISKKIKDKSKLEYFLYGGSVSADNVRSFTETEGLDGVLVGTDSLDAEKFISIVNNA